MEKDDLYQTIKGKCRLFSVLLALYSNLKSIAAAIENVNTLHMQDE